MNHLSKLVSVTHLYDRTLNQIKENIFLNVSSFHFPVNYSLSAYKVEYFTYFLGKRIVASAIVYIPQNFPGEAPLLSYQHETIFCQNETPSKSSMNQIPEIISASGFIVLVPDYIGYGSSNEYQHPYYVKEIAANTVIDLIEASKVFLTAKNIFFRQQLFLVGFSEGGFVTLAAQQQLEKEPMPDLFLTGVCACAGGYDLIHLLSSFKSGKQQQVQLPYILFLLLSYRYVYKLNSGSEYFFNPKYVKIIGELFSGKHNSEYIKGNLPNDITQVLNGRFLENLVGTGELDLKKAIIANNLGNWAPVTPLRLYHSIHDEVMPYENSLSSFKSYSSFNGNKTAFITLEGLRHEQSAYKMLEDALPWFHSLK